MRNNIKIRIEDGMNKHSKTIRLNVQTRSHTELGVMLHGIMGMKKSAPNSYPEGMNHSEVFHFTLQKDTRSSWEELLPKIKEVIKNYFTKKYSTEKPVEFQDISTLHKTSYFGFPGLKTSNPMLHARRA